MAGVLKPETKVKRVIGAEKEAAKARKKYDGFASTRARLETQLAKLTDEELERRRVRYETAADAVKWLEGAPTTDKEEYERLVAEARAAVEAANAKTEDEDALEDEDAA